MTASSQSPDVSALPIFYRNWVPACILVLACSLAVSCVSSPYKTGIALMDRGDYVGAYRIFSDLSARYPGNPEFYERRQTAARLEYRRQMALTRESLLRSDLQGFLAHVDAAGQIKPDSTAAELGRLVRSARASGKDDRSILRELLRSLQAEGLATDAATSLGVVADGLAEAVSAGRIPPPLYVLPFNAATDIPSPEVVMLRNLFIEDLTRRKLQVVDRNLMDKILAEQKFQRSDLVDPVTCVEAGRLLGAASFVAADITRDGDNRLIQFRAVKTATAETTWSDSALTTPPK